MCLTELQGLRTTDGAPSTPSTLALSPLERNETLPPPALRSLAPAVAVALEIRSCITITSNSTLQIRHIEPRIVAGTKRNSGGNTFTAHAHSTLHLTQPTQHTKYIKQILHRIQPPCTSIQSPGQAPFLSPHLTSHSTLLGRSNQIITTVLAPQTLSNDHLHQTLHLPHI